MLLYTVDSLLHNSPTGNSKCRRSSTRLWRRCETAAFFDMRCQRIYTLIHRNRTINTASSVAEKKHIDKRAIQEQQSSLTSVVFFWQVRAMSTCRDSSNLLEPGRRPVRSQIPVRCSGRKPGRRPAASWNFAYHALSSELAAS